MLLTPDQVLALCEKPAHQQDLLAGRALERQHQLHVDGEPALVLEFLRAQRVAMSSEESQLVLEKTRESGTAPIYDGIANILSKVFTAAGTTVYHEFTDPQLAQDFEAYLKDTARTGTSFYRDFEATWFKASLTGFQGVMLVDLPAEPSDEAGEGLPRPFFRYVASAEIHDVAVTGNKVEYLILQERYDTFTDFYVWDDRYCFRVRHADGSYTRLPALDNEHALGYVPACPITTIKPNLQRPVLRSSVIAKSLGLANVYLRDFCNHELGKSRFAHPKPWSYGVACTHEAPAVGDSPIAACNAGWLYYPTGKIRCPRCKGKGRYIPYDRDEGYIVEAPQQGEPQITPPAGYVIPDLESLKYLGDELKVNESKIERAVLGKDGILTMQTKVETAAGKEMDLGPVEDRLAVVSENAEFCMKFVIDAHARYRYRASYKQSQVNFGRRYHVRNASALEYAYEKAKAAGLDDSTLYSYLEDIIYTKYAGDPMELQRNLLKLELTPFPTQTVKEAKDNGIATPQDLLLKQYLNDFVARFERENGSILDFASALPHATKIERIQDQFTEYLTEKQNGRQPEPQPVV
ncbi:hypothetical protein [Hymenobacter koreensis]|uniref:Phage portal protein n=1 Tax=Hymenobacter koreensis TaxID=1084523 RepID=A0ABP8JNB4_9BACT